VWGRVWAESVSEVWDGGGHLRRLHRLQDREAGDEAAYAFGEHALCPYVRREGNVGSALDNGAPTLRLYALHMGKVGIRRIRPLSIGATYATR